MNNVRNILKNSTRQFGKVCLAIGGASVIQGSYFITRYRLNHGEAPHPISPSRGIVSSNEWNVSKTNAAKDSGEEGLLPPLKILVVGDSLACGCGIAKSSTPILPESIARHLARQLGRPVHWSCVGVPGASTKGIMNILHKWFSRGESIEANAEYDVVVVLAGMNDIKDILLPFLAYETADSSFGDGLKKIFGVLKQKLRIHKTIPSRDGNDHQLHEQIRSQSRSLMVLPALPTHAIPLLSYPPIGLFLNSIINYMDSAKQQLSQEHPNKILYVEAPSQTLIQKIERGTSKLCADLKSERALISFHDVKSDVKRKIERLMHEHSTYFERDADCEAEVECEQAWYSNLRPKIPELGSSLVSYDSIHPNEKGYNYWGRHIAAAIIDEWKRGHLKEKVTMRDDCVA